MKAKEQWIEETLGSLEGIQGAKASSVLASRIGSIPDQTDIVSMPKRSLVYWQAAAALALILTMNIVVFTNYHRSSVPTKDATEILADDYLSYLNPIKI